MNTIISDEKSETELDKGKLESISKILAVDIHWYNKSKETFINKKNSVFSKPLAILSLKNQNGILYTRSQAEASKKINENKLSKKCYMKSIESNIHKQETESYEKKTYVIEKDLNTYKKLFNNIDNLFSDLIIAVNKFIESLEQFSYKNNINDVISALKGLTKQKYLDYNLTTDNDSNIFPELAKIINSSPLTKKTIIQAIEVIKKLEGNNEADMTLDSKCNMCRNQCIPYSCIKLSCKHMIDINCLNK